MKFCPRCERIKPVSEFHKASKARDGLHFRCKDCQREHAQNYYKANRDKVRAQVVRYREANPESHQQASRSYSRRRYQQNRESAKVYGQQWRENNPDYQRQWRDSHRETVREQERERLRQRYHADPDYRARVMARVEARRAKKLGLGSDLLVLDFLVQRDLGICQICLNPVLEAFGPRGASPDHVIPLSRGGPHEYGNLQLSHLSCNHRKNSRILT